ncbi:sigma 54-interacting transcriptional regulator [Sedimentibacter sp. zth1]|uniref:sigma-54 interaction domain-containing protein n=1 Tax=Sedimentibacter sp. zth1 TaxID=2816908 RepID=UPI001A9144E4|nr:sigma 54-interacting transcriptional regulator [Sedimentibacter sp. zth1]QSX05255.1 sigma 54-interacting transcriptional regulator [Sedimentibacter sp. zth1]
MESKFFDALIKAVEQIDDGIHIIDSSGKIIYYNKAAKELDGIDVNKAMGRHILEVYPSLDFETSTLLQVMKTCKPLFKVEQNFVNYKGNKISTVNTSLPITYNNRIIGAVEISKNITRVKELSEKIVNLQSALYKNVSNVTKTKNTAVFNFLDIVGQCKEMLKIKSLGIKAAESDSPVLVSGATGTGKELIVQSIHNASKRRSKPFIAQNCAALPTNLLESILFGSVKGSFTGAENRAGLFELAHGGTLFLDEINSMPLELQAKLLRVLQDGRLRRVGASSTIDIDVRIISAINIPVQKILETSQLRQDLFYRLNVITFEIPSLKQRIEDLPLLIKHFINKYNKKCQKFFTGVSKEVLEIFMKYDWPGNVRELEHAIESAISLYDGEIIREEHLPFQFKYLLNNSTNLMIDSDDTCGLEQSLEKYEKELIISALQKVDWNVTKAAKLLNIPRQTLQYKIKKLAIS